MNAKGRLALDLTVEQGRGYLSAERNKRTSTIGVIPVDAIFSPVRRVAFSVEPTRVEQATNYDKLTLEIETDGSITPARRARVGGRHAAQPRRPRRRPVRRAARASSSARSSPTDVDVARPRPADRGARPVGAAAQLPQAGAGRHDRPARAEDRGRPARDHELRFEVARRGHPEARRARPVAAGEGVGADAGAEEGPALRRRTPRTSGCMMANLAAQPVRGRRRSPPPRPRPRRCGRTPRS